MLQLCRVTAAGGYQDEHPVLIPFNILCPIWTIICRGRISALGLDYPVYVYRISDFANLVVGCPYGINLYALCFYLKTFVIFWYI
jgi:hypothetical protein